jgi:hypothetical protein
MIFSMQIFLQNQTLVLNLENFKQKLMDWINIMHY